MKRTVLVTILAISASLAGAQTIGDFTCVDPSNQDDNLHIPSTHSFQLVSQSGDQLMDGSEMGPGNDFTGFVPLGGGSTGSSTEGHLCVNSEWLPGGVSIFHMEYNANTKLWDILSSGNVDFSMFESSLPFPLPNVGNKTPGTLINCSGGITPWGTVVTCEENDQEIPDVFGADIYGYQPLGWNIEIDPVTKSVVDYGNDGNKDKAWAMGRMKHENVCFTSDSAISYYGDDNSSTGFLFKFVMDQKADLSSGDLYVYKLNQTLDGGDWIQLGNTTVAERNSTVDQATNVDATVFDRVEDVEIGPDDKVYFAATGADRIYRVNQDGTDFEIYVDNTIYPILDTDTSMVFDSPDNLCFDGDGNLFCMQDGGNGYLWVIRPDHSPTNPKLGVFANTPKGCESTGMTFTPDYKFMFVSFQHPDNSNSNSQADAADKNVLFNRDATVIIARNENLGIVGVDETDGFNAFTFDRLFPNPVETSFVLRVKSNIFGSAIMEVYDAAGKLVKSAQYNLHYGFNELQMNTATIAAGQYLLKLTHEKGEMTTKFEKK